MQDQELDNLYRLWSRLNSRMVELMLPCEDRRGILFLSRDDSGNEAARELAKHLTQSVFAFDLAKETPQKEEWEQELAFIKDPDAGVSLFKAAPRKPCIIVAGLDSAPQWLFSSLKGLMDHPSMIPFNCLATAAALEPIPDWLNSHFWVCRKSGRPKTR
jgi:hypothetical protein